MPEKLTDNEIEILTEVVDIIENIRQKYNHIDPQTYALLKELEQALLLFDL